jgi:two-component system chemotaxis response regulator CheB
MKNKDSRPIKVLIIDDSGLVRIALSRILREDKEIDVVGKAKDGRQGLAMAEEFDPDIITLDVNMPGMDGLEVLDKLKERGSNARVIMVSSLTTEGAKDTFEALSRGAVDFIPKSFSNSGSTISHMQKALGDKIKSLAIKYSPGKDKPKKEEVVDAPAEISSAGELELLAIGTSTGGPAALQQILTSLDKKFPAGGLIVQHMPKEFIGPFAERLNDLSNVAIQVAEHGQPVRPGEFLLAPGNLHLKLQKKGRGRPFINLDTEPSDSLHRPSVDQMFLSLAENVPGRALGVVLTGMGYDGLVGAKAMKATNSPIFAQEEKSCVVYGMPRGIVEAHLADRIFPLGSMAKRITDMFVS